MIHHYLGNDDAEDAPDAATLAGIAEVIESLAQHSARGRAVATTEGATGAPMT